MSVRAPRGLGSHILLDLTPLRRSRDYRELITGLGVSVLGNQLTTVAVPFQVYAITRSSLVVGLVSLAQLFPLIFGSLLGGSLVDAMDRRKILIVVETIGALCSAALALNADLGPQLWPLFLFPAIDGGAVRDRQLGAERHAARPGRHGAAARLQRDLPVAVPDRGDRRARRRRAAARRGWRAPHLLDRRRQLPARGVGGDHDVAAAGAPPGRRDRGRPSPRPRGPAGGRRSRGCGSCAGPSRCRAPT